MTLSHGIPPITLLRHIVRKHGNAKTHSVRAQLRASLHTHQRNFIDNPARVKAALTGRRAGKSYAERVSLWESALTHPGEAFSLYVGLTRRAAKMQMWPGLKKINRELAIGAVPNETELTLTLPNGHVIFLGGADTADEIEKFRGYPYAKVVLDEAGSMGPHIRPLIKDVAEWGTVDHDGVIEVVGTPGPVCHGIFWEMTADDSTEPDEKVPTHNWTCLDNPFVPMAAAWLEGRKRKRGWTDDHPTYRREFLGRWVPDSSALVYQYDSAKNAWDGHDMQGQGPWIGTLGIDLGYNPDPVAFAVVRWSHGSRKAYVTHAEKHLDWIPSRIFEHANKLMAEHNVVKIVVDGPKGLIEEWSQRFRIPLTAPINKKAKREHIELINDDLRTGNLLIKNGLPVIHEMRTVVWDDKRKTPSDRAPNDLTDAMEYAWVACGAFAHRERENTADHAPTSHTERAEQRADKEAEAAEQRAIRDVRRAEREAQRWSDMGM